MVDFVAVGVDVVITMNMGEFVAYDRDFVVADGDKMVIDQLLMVVVYIVVGFVGAVGKLGIDYN
jgi:hypothetical protein